MKPEIPLSNLKYERIQSIEEFHGSACIVVKSLHPDYYLLFGSVKLIITETGSALSHLAILAREHNIPVFLAEKAAKIPTKGTVSIRGNEMSVE